MAGSWLDQKVCHGVELLKGLSSSARDTAQWILGNLKFDSGLLGESRVESIEQRAAAREIDAGLVDIGHDLRRHVGKRLADACDDLMDLERELLGDILGLKGDVGREAAMQVAAFDVDRHALAV